MCANRDTHGHTHLRRQRCQLMSPIRAGGRERSMAPWSGLPARRPPRPRWVRLRLLPRHAVRRHRHRGLDGIKPATGFCLRHLRLIRAGHLHGTGVHAGDEGDRPGQRVEFQVYEDHPGEFNLASPDGEMAGTNIHFWLDPYASTPHDRPIRTAGRTPTALIRWLRGNPNFIVSAPVNRRIAHGTEAASVDLTSRPPRRAPIPVAPAHAWPTLSGPTSASTTGPARASRSGSISHHLAPAPKPTPSSSQSTHRTRRPSPP